MSSGIVHTAAWGDEVAFGLFSLLCAHPHPSYMGEAVGRWSGGHFWGWMWFWLDQALELWGWPKVADFEGQIGLVMECTWGGLGGFGAGLG